MLWFLSLWVLLPQCDACARPDSVIFLRGHRRGGISDRRRNGRKIARAPNPPKAIGPYSQAVEATDSFSSLPDFKKRRDLCELEK